MANPKAQALLASNRQAMTGGFPGTNGPQPAGAQESQAPLFDSWDVQQGLQPGWAMQVYSSAIGLPRTFETFRSGQFSPLEPVYPMPIDVGEEPSGRPRPRRWQAPVGWNLPVGQPGSEGLKLANFQFLREIAEPVSVLRSCIETVKVDLLGLLDGLDPIQPTPSAMLDQQGDPKKRRDFEKRKAEVMEFLSNPDPDQYDSLEDWLNALWEDSLVLDAVGIYLQPAGGKGNGPLGSDLGALALVDGSTLRPLVDEWSARPRPPEPYLQQYIWGVPRTDLMDMINLGPDATLADIQALNPVLEEITETVDQWSGDQCLYFMTNPRTATPYGFGPVEQGMLVASMIWARQTWQWSFYSSGSLPSVFLDPGESIATAEEARQLQEAINMLGGDIAGMHQVIVLPPGAKPMEQKPVDLTGQFDEWSAALMCMPFGLNIGDLGITPKVASMESPGSAKAQAMMAADKTIHRSTQPRAQKLKRKVLDRVIQGKLGQEDMEWSWGLTEENENKNDLVTQTVDLFHNSISTLDEARIAVDMDPIGIEGVTDVPMVFLPTGAIPLHASIELALNPPEPPAAPTPPALGPNKPPPPKALPPGPGKKPPPGTKPKPGTGTAAAQSKPVLGAETGAQAVEAAPPDQHVSSEGKKARATELATLRRYLRRGGHLADFVPKALSPAVLKVGLRPSNVEGAIASITKALAHVEARAVGINLSRAAIVDGVGKEADKLSNGQTDTADFVASVGDLLHDQLKEAYQAGAELAASELGAEDIVDAATTVDDAVATRVANLTPHLSSFASDIANGDQSEAEIANRTAMWGDQASPAFEDGYVTTGAPSGAGIIWHLGETSDPCDLCLDRDGQSFTEDEINGIGFPGDGSFGGDTCLGGPRCGCWLEFVKDGETQAVTGSPSQARVNSMTPDTPTSSFEAYNDLVGAGDADTGTSATAQTVKRYLTIDQAKEMARYAQDPCPNCESPNTGLIPPDFETARCVDCEHTFTPKDFSLSGGPGGAGSPLASGFVPFNLTGPGKPPKKRKKRKKVERFDDADAAKRAMRFYPEADYEVDGAWIYLKAAEPPRSSAEQVGDVTVRFAGLCVRAEDTGRVLMLQRAMDDVDEGSDQAGGSWEWPGGHLEDGETPFAGACREWSEEVGHPLPAGKVVAEKTEPNGYQLFVYSIPHETDVDINQGPARTVANPDGDAFEACAWWNVNDAAANPALRPEVAASKPWSAIRTPIGKAAEASIEEAEESGPPRLQGSSIDEGEVLDYLQEHYPNSDIGWVRRCLWAVDNVLLSDVNWENRPGGVDQDKVDAMAAKLEDDWQPHPVVVIAPSATDQLEVADGYHRFAALDQAGIGAAAAWVGTPKPGNVGWRADVQAMQWAASNWTPPSQDKTLTKTLPADLAARTRPGDLLEDDEEGERFRVKAVRGVEVDLERL